MIFRMIVLIVALAYSIYMNSLLCGEKDVLRKELHQAKADLSKLKLLNKLKVDYNGNPIIYEEFIEGELQE